MHVDMFQSKIGKFVARAIVQKQQRPPTPVLPVNFAIKLPQPLLEDCYEHPGLSVAPIRHRQTGDGHVLEAARLRIFTNYQRIQLVRAVGVRAQCNRKSLLVFLASREASCRQCPIWFQPTKGFAY